MIRTRLCETFIALAALLALPVTSGDAAACGCLAPPIPKPEAVNFAVNQESEQIIFEVEEGMISQHVLIRYAGAAEAFAWLLPVPSVPEISLSYSSIFGLVDAQTQPVVRRQDENLCPAQKYRCRSHPPCPVYRPPSSPVSNQAGASASLPGNFINDAQNAPAQSESEAAPPPVKVFAREIVGDYETVVLGSGDAQLIIDWLQENQFLVSDALAPFMQPYLDAEQLFVASKLVPGANVKQMRPLKLRYEGENPSIPLRLTPVAAEPHLTVTAFIYANKEFEPVAQDITTIPEDAYGFSKEGRSNYPMALARAVDDAGGAAFVREYVGRPPVFKDTTGCCDGSFQNNFGGVPFPGPPGGGSSQVDPAVGDDGIVDVCGVGNDGVCQCPSADFDAADCTSDPDAAGTVLLAEQLSTKYSTLSRLTTRVSPEEMTFDPAFKAKSTATEAMRLQVTVPVYSVDRCVDRVAPSDQQKYSDAEQSRACDAVYCGDGECVITKGGAACDCDKGYVARTFTDLDGAPSITCVPLLPPKTAADVDLPSPCDGKEIAHGACVEAGGFAAAVCDAGYAAGTTGPRIAGIPESPECLSVTARSGGTGGTNSNRALEGLRVCSPKPPMCAADGWIEEQMVGGNPGVDCDDNVPDPSWFIEPPKPLCRAVTAPGTNTGTARAPAVAPRPLALMDTTKPKPSSSSRGCSVSSPSGRPLGSGFGFAALGLLGAALVRRRS